MSNILEQIVASKRQELARAQETVPYRELQNRLAQAPPVRDFRAALERAPGVGIIAEVKKASPSAGVIRADFDPVAIARTYEQHGASCISVLTDEPFFQGHLNYLSAIRAAVSLPLLRKDFLIDPYQLLEARVAGADAVLLIAEILDDATFTCLHREALGLGMQALVEVHELDNLRRMLRLGARLVGVNNRNLKTFETKLDHTLQMVPKVPPHVLLVSESGIHGHQDVSRLKAAGVKAVLVGETLMRSPDIGRKLDELRGLP